MVAVEVRWKVVAKVEISMVVMENGQERASHSRSDLKVFCANRGARAMVVVMELSVDMALPPLSLALAPWEAVVS
jgi:hypothetical protein